MKVRNFVLVIAFSVVQVACCTARTRVLPKSGSRADIISTSSKEDCAYEKAKEKAAKYCSKKGKRYVIQKDKSKYRGMDRTAKGVIEGAGAVMGKSVYLSRSDDYKVRIAIKCVR